MKKSVLLAILIPLLVLVLLAGGTFAYLTITSSPQKVFEKTVSKTFEMVKDKQKKYTTMKSNVELSANIESYNEEIKQINEISKDAKITIGTELDTNDLFFYNSIKILNGEEKLFDADLILQDQKFYVAVLDWFDKYIELPSEDVDVSELTETINKNATVDMALATEAVKQVLLDEMSRQNFSKEKTIIVIDGQNVNVVKNYLELTEQQQIVFIREILEKIKNNNSFQVALGDYKEEVFKKIDETINNSTMQETDNNKKIVYSIYTSGMLNQFVAADVNIMENDSLDSGVEIVNYNNVKGFNIYTGNEGNKDYNLKINDKQQEGSNKGTTTITIFDNGEEHTITCNYEKIGNQTIFNADLNIDQDNLNITGTLIQDNNRYNGDVTFTYKGSEYGSISLKIVYQIIYNEEILRVNIGNNVTKLDEMTEEEQATLTENFTNSKIYQLFNEFVSGQMPKISVPTIGEYIELEDYRINYNIPDGWFKVKTVNGGAQFAKDNNKINIGIIEQNYETCLNMIDENYIGEYNVSDTTDYEISDMKYKYKTVIGEKGGYLYFIYPLDETKTYMVSVETEDGNVDLEDINSFLEISINNDESFDEAAARLEENLQTQIEEMQGTIDESYTSIDVEPEYY